MASRRSTRISALNDLRLNHQLSNSDLPEQSKPLRKRKGDELIHDIGDANGELQENSTPKRKASTVTFVPSTPTPAAVNALAKTSRPLEFRDTTPEPATERLANPYATNAPLITPQTFRLVSSKALADASPSKSSEPRLTTSNILAEATKHLIDVEPKLKPIIEKHYCHIFSAEGLSEVIDPFVSLCSSIIGQQVSGAAAKSIKAKFVGLFNQDVADVSKHIFPTPSKVAATSIEVLRTAGLSQRKAEYIQGLAEKFANGDLTTEMLLKADYEEVFEKLIAVRGLGKWSVEMFACFGLKRLDVFSTGDLGVQRGMAALMGRDVGKLKAKGGGKWKYMSEKEMLEISEKFAPYRSVFMWYTWRVEEVDTAVLES